MTEMYGVTSPLDLPSSPENDIETEQFLESDHNTFTRAYNQNTRDTEKRVEPLLDQVKTFGGKIILDFDNTIDIDSDYTLGQTAGDWLNDMATSGVDAYLVTGNGNKERIKEAILAAVDPENQGYWEELLDKKAFYAAGDKSDEYQEILAGDTDPSKWMLVDDSSRNVKDFLQETGNKGFVYEPNHGYAKYDEFADHLEGFVKQLGGNSNSGDYISNPNDTTVDSPPSQATVDSWYETYNNEAAGRHDNEMSEREIRAFRNDDSLSSAERAIASTVYENRKTYDVDGNGRFNREEFRAAVADASAAAPSSGSGSTTSSPASDSDTLYERYNDEAAKGKDNEMSKREIQAYKDDPSLSNDEKLKAQYIFDNRKTFDSNGNGRLSREEFIRAYDAASRNAGGSENSRPDVAPPQSDKVPGSGGSTGSTTGDYEHGQSNGRANVERQGTLTLGGKRVDFTAQGGVLKQSSKNVGINTSVENGDTQFVTIGTSNGGDDKSLIDTPLDKKLLENQGFTLLGVEGSKDKRVEMWARVYDGKSMNDTVTLSANSKDVGYSIHTLESTLNLKDLSVQKDAFDKSGNDKIKFDGNNKYDLKLGAVFFDDSVEVKGVGGSIKDYGKFEGKSDENTMQFFKQGDGDGFFVGIWGEGENVRDSYSIDNHAPGGRQHESIFVGANM